MERKNILLVKFSLYGKILCKFNGNRKHEEEESVIDLGETSLRSGPARYVTKITRIAMETWSLNAPWIFVWIESYESSFEPDR